MAVQVGAQASAVRAHEELFAYWAARREGARLPRRANIDPRDLKRMLPTISLIDVTRDPRDYRLRLAGTGLYRVYGREITGRALEDIYASGAAEYWRRELDKVVDQRRPAAGVHNFAWRGAPHLTVLWLRLPLASNGEDVDMILGYDAVIGQAGSLTSGIRAA
ncbi:MAG: motility/cell cycle regulatory protein MopJ [Caulobacteraceae bacterium]